MRKVLILTLALSLVVSVTFLGVAQGLEDNFPNPDSMEKISISEAGDGNGIVILLVEDEDNQIKRHAGRKTVT